MTHSRRRSRCGEARWTSYSTTSSVSTFWTILFTVHALLAVALLGALTHQAAAVLMPVRQAPAPPAASSRAFAPCTGRAMRSRSACCGSSPSSSARWIYTKYRIYVRIPIEQQGFWKTQGAFELKEHLATIGLGLLPIYWLFWKNARNAGLRKRAQMADRRCWPRCAGSCSWPATSSTTSAASDHEHDSSGRAARAIRRNLHRLPHLRDRVRDRVAGDLHGLRHGRTGRCSPTIPAPTT